MPFWSKFIHFNCFREYLKPYLTFSRLRVPYLGVSLIFNGFQDYLQAFYALPRLIEAFFVLPVAFWTIFWWIFGLELIFQWFLSLRRLSGELVQLFAKKSKFTEVQNFQLHYAHLNSSWMRFAKRKTCLREGVEIENRVKYSNNFISVWQKSGFAVATWLRGPGFEGPILLDFVFAFSRANSKSNKTENCVCAPDPPSLTHYSNTRDGWKNKCDMIWQFCGTRNRSRVNVCFMLCCLCCVFGFFARCRQRCCG